MHDFKNLKSFESSNSGVYSFNTPIGKEQIDSVEEGKNYMFFQNLTNMVKMAKEILELDSSEIDTILEDGHDWAEDHISVALENLSQVNNFLCARSDSSESPEENTPSEKKESDEDE